MRWNRKERSKFQPLIDSVMESGTKGDLKLLKRTYEKAKAKMEPEATPDEMKALEDTFIIARDMAWYEMHKPSRRRGSLPRGSSGGRRKFRLASDLLEYAVESVLNAAKMKDPADVDRVYRSMTRLLDRKKLDAGQKELEEAYHTALDRAKLHQKLCKDAESKLKSDPGDGKALGVFFENVPPDPQKVQRVMALVLSGTNWDSRVYGDNGVLLWDPDGDNYLLSYNGEDWGLPPAVSGRSTGKTLANWIFGKSGRRQAGKREEPLRRQLIRLAYHKPQIRREILSLLK